MPAMPAMPVCGAGAGGFASRRLVLVLLLLAALYLTLYTWNQRTGLLDTLAEETGLRLVVAVLRPSEWGSGTLGRLWTHYADLRGVESENRRLRGELDRLHLELNELREAATQARRLESLLEFEPPAGWKRQGARVLSQQFGPAGVLKTILIDKGRSGGVDEDAAVMVPRGLVGRIYKAGAAGATVLLLQDPNSRIPVISQESRTPGILTGQGPGEPLALNYVPLDAKLREGELLITSGLADVLPHGIPVARVGSVARSDFTQFQEVTAQPMVDPYRLEEVLVVSREQPLVTAPTPAPGKRETSADQPARGAEGGHGAKETAVPRGAETKVPGHAEPDPAKPKLPGKPLATPPAKTLDKQPAKPAPPVDGTQHTR